MALATTSRANSKATLEYVPYEKAYEEGFEDMRRRVPDLSKISKLIGYAPTLTTEEIVDRVIAHERGRGPSSSA